MISQINFLISTNVLIKMSKLNLQFSFNVHDKNDSTINRSNASFNLFANTTSKIELFEQFSNESRSTIASITTTSITTIFIIVVSIVVALIVESNSIMNLTFQMFQQLRDIMKKKIQQFNHYIFDRRDQLQQNFTRTSNFVNDQKRFKIIDFEFFHSNVSKN